MSGKTNPIYFDYSATTPVDERVAAKMAKFMTMDGMFGNPASRSHKFGWDADDAVEQARADVAALVNADPKRLYGRVVRLSPTTWLSRVRHILMCVRVSTLLP